MKTFFLTTLAGLLLSLTVSAQQIPGRPHHRHHGKQAPHQMQQKQRQQLAQQLNLTEAQKQNMKEQNEKFRLQMQDLKKQDQLTVKEWRSRMEKLRKDQKESLQQILTPEQKQQMTDMRAKREERGRQMMDRRFDHMKTRLALTEQQSATLQKERAALQEKMKALRENKSLSDEKKREEMKNLMQQHRESMKSVLTDEQRSKLQPQGPPSRKVDRKPFEKTPREKSVI